MTDAEEITTQRSTVDEWTEGLAQSTGSPGGGAGAGVMLGIAASLTSMVAGYTEADPERRDRLRAILTRSETLRQSALHLADDDATASRAFGAAFTLEKGPEREEAIREAAIGAAQTSAELGDHAVAAIEDLSWLAEHGKRAVIADVVVAFGALRAAVAGARTNASFDLATLKSSGSTLEEIHDQHPRLWNSVETLTAAIERIDACTASIDHRAAPTHADSAT
ncbi:cyclodeaminase/cyclohydrolase family protein [Nesterenkonia sp. E16_7]|uniref:cyclodeaminase/cyclohydrolase family protein n=1 Tax=unclassified Nesterenkonia TaxID=2629769 RepID=UPI001A91A5BA|nr:MULTISPECIES: cyclodeaminase/cyclohydrolase family protein [unclassified Nesterenkonia]MBO0595926.1 cyclodeaminase/cyclohydrolase family protein [Nesterenkonia sp. E16_10]MBO0599474.1 cyclodeaminase/cyclohydrolase family protein [Nesterenkonia sp. E16_7]